ncbi:MAG: helix-turn-helix domain-containing protein, partial [Syntrophales bacterium]|nr:helix-turn-helix domain-containing protein [Syntrophales bacterium]
ELENIMERAFILCKAGMIEPHHLPEPFYTYQQDEGRQALETVSIKDMEAIFLTNALRRNGWNRLKTARQLGIHKSTLYRKIKGLHIQISGQA